MAFHLRAGMTSHKPTYDYRCASKRLSANAPDETICDSCRNSLCGKGT